MEKKVDERKIMQFIENNKFIIFFMIITALSLLLRSKMFNYISDDFKDYLSPWFNEIKEGGGLLALKNQIGNYNAPYMTIMALLTYIPISPLISIKLVSLVFDYICAFTVVEIIKTLLKDNKNVKIYMLLGYSIVLFLPTVFLNSACWAQADSIYTTFVLISLLYLFRQKYTKSFIFLGIAFSFKLQIVFILPLYILMYISERKFSIYNFLIIPLVDLVMCIPSMIFGKSITDCIMIYFNQAGEYGNFLTMNFPNVYSMFIKSIYNDAPNLIQNTNDIIGTIGLFFTMFVFIIIALMVLYKKIKFDNRAIIEFGIWSILIATFFLPHMHDRYMYMADVIGIVYLIYNKRKFYIPLIIELVSLYTYMYYLFNSTAISIQLVSILNFVMLIIYSADMCKRYFYKNKTDKIE